MSDSNRMTDSDRDDPLVLVDAARDGVAVVTMNRAAKKNALSMALRDAISDVLDALADDGDVRCVVLTGAGDTCSAGFDLSEFERAFNDPAFDALLWRSSDRYHHTLLSFPLPLVAAVNGPALGGGMDTAVMCDIRIGSSTARFGHPEVKFADVVYGPLHDLIGGAAARELCLTGRTVDATEARRMGLLSDVVEPGRLNGSASAIAAEIAGAPRDVLVRTKAKIIERAATGITRTLDL